MWPMHSLVAILFFCQETLDADGAPLVDRNGRVMNRDIVQFIQLQKHQTLSGSFSLVSWFSLVVCVIIYYTYRPEKP